MINRLCIFTSSYSPNKQAMLNYLEKIIPSSIKIYLFVPNTNKDRFILKKIKLVNTLSNKYTSFVELRDFCRKNRIQRLINIGQVPYEVFIMIYASLLTKTDFIVYHLGNPIDSLSLPSFKIRLRAVFEIMISYFLSLLPQKILLVSENQIRRINRYLFFARRKIFLLPATVPTSFFKPKNKALCRKKLHLGAREKIIIFVGRIGYLKGSDILIYLVKKNPHKKFILIGQIIDKRIKEEIEKSNFKNLLLLQNKTQKELIDYYNASDLCVFPSRIEGTPLVPREAMSCGVPAIVSDIPSTESLKESIKINLNAGEANKAVQDFFNLSKSERKELSDKSREFVIKKYDDYVWKKQYIDKILN